MGSIFYPYLNLNSFYILFRVSGRKQSKNVLDWEIPVPDRRKAAFTLTYRSKSLLPTTPISLPICVHSL